MALYTVPNSNPVRTIDSMTVSVSSNQVPLGGQVLISCRLTCTNFMPIISATLGGQLVLSDFSRVSGFRNGATGSLIQNITPPGSGPRTSTVSIGLTVGRNSGLIGKSFSWTFLTGFPVSSTTGPITVIAATVPNNPNPSPNTCSEIRPNINWSGNFVYFPLGNLITYPTIFWLADGITSTDSNVNWRDREFFPL